MALSFLAVLTTVEPGSIADSHVDLTCTCLIHVSRRLSTARRQNGPPDKVGLARDLAQLRLPSQATRIESMHLKALTLGLPHPLLFSDPGILHCCSFFLCFPPLPLILREHSGRVSLVSAVTALSHLVTHGIALVPLFQPRSSSDSGPSSLLFMMMLTTLAAPLPTAGTLVDTALFANSNTTFSNESLSMIVTRTLLVCRPETGVFPSWSGNSSSTIRIFLSISVIIWSQAHPGVVASSRTIPLNCFAVKVGSNLIRSLLHAWKPSSSRTAPITFLASPVVRFFKALYTRMWSSTKSPNCATLAAPTDVFLRKTAVLERLLEAWGLAVHVLLLPASPVLRLVSDRLRNYALVGKE